MTIAERINLHKCGYTRAEIDALAKEEKEAAKNPEPAQEETKPAENQPEEKDPVLEAIKGLTAAIQARNIHEDTQPEAKKETMEDLINQV